MCMADYIVSAVFTIISTLIAALFNSSHDIFHYYTLHELDTNSSVRHRIFLMIRVFRRIWEYHLFDAEQFDKCLTIVFHKDFEYFFLAEKYWMYHKCLTNTVSEDGKSNLNVAKTVLSEHCWKKIMIEIFVLKHNGAIQVKVYFFVLWKKKTNWNRSKHVAVNGVFFNFDWAKSSDNSSNVFFLFEMTIDIQRH